MLISIAFATTLGFYLSKKATFQSSQPQPVRTFQTGSSAVYQLAFEPNGEVLTALSQTHLTRWKVGQSRVLNSTPVGKGTSFKDRIALAPDGQTFATVDSGKQAGVTRVARWRLSSAETKPYYVSVPLQVRRKVNLFRTRDNKLLKSLALPDDTGEVQIAIQSLSIKGEEPVVMVQTQEGFLMGSTNPDTDKSAKLYAWNARTGRPCFGGPMVRPPSDLYNREPYAIASRPPRAMKLVSEKTIEGDVKVSWLKLPGGKNTLMSDTGGEDFKTDYQWDSPVALKDGEQFFAICIDPGTTRPFPLYCFDSELRAPLWKRTYIAFTAHVLALSPDGRYLACGGENTSKPIQGYHNAGELLILDSKTGKVLYSFGLSGKRSLMEEWQLRKNTAADSIFVSNSSRGQQRFLPGDGGPVTALAFSPNNHTLAAGYEDGSIKLWQIP